MRKTMTLNIRLGGVLADFVAAKVAHAGTYETAAEYVRDLIRRDMERAQREAFARLKAELTDAFYRPDSNYHALTADEIIARN